jgi:hypothetical protein
VGSLGADGVAANLELEAQLLEHQAAGPLVAAIPICGLSVGRGHTWTRRHVDDRTSRVVC